MSDRPADPRKRYIKVTNLLGGESFVTDDFNLADVSNLLRECSPGDGFKIQVIKMLPKDYENLPEFTGF